MSFLARTISSIAAALTASVVLLLAAATATSAATPSLGQLHSQLGAQQTHAQSLTASIGSLNHLIGALDAQVSLVQNREAAVSSELNTDRAKLAQVQTQLTRERIRLTLLRHRLADARVRLARQLVGSYESSKPDLVSVVLSANGFNNLLEQLDFLGRVEHQQQSIISATRTARTLADATARRLAKLQQSDRQITQATEIRVRALAGMNDLLQSKQGALQSARGAQQ
ncbi:MAG: hypothetical protein ACR2NR_16655, partial [Solirubrobacteraceae bacterium]